MNKPQGCAGPCLAIVTSDDRDIKQFKDDSIIPDSRTNQAPHLAQFSRESYETQQGGAQVKAIAHPSRRDRYLLQISQGDRFWAYPIAWTKAELMALRMVARQQIRAMDLSLTDAGPPVDVGKLYQLVERLYPSVARVAAMASAQAGEVAA